MHAIAAGEAQKVRHFGAVKDRSRWLWIFSSADILLQDQAIFVDVVAILAGDMIFIFLDDAIFARRRFVTFFPGRDVRFADKMFAFVKISALLVEMNDDLRRPSKIITAPIGSPRMRRGERGPESIRKNPAWSFQPGLKLCAARTQ